MRVVIVGAGIGGLVAALRLHREGVDCAVYEQAEQVRELGVGINLLPPAVTELAAVGLLQRLDEVGVRTRELLYTHRLGQQILRRDCGLDAGLAVPQFSMHRGRLQGLLLRAVHERLGDGAIHTGHRLTGFEYDTDAVHATFADPSGTNLPPVRSDVLVGADGIHSAVRARLFPREGPPRWNGVTMWRGATDWPAYATGRTVIIAGGTTAKLVVYPIAAGRTPGSRLTNWAICVRTGRDGDPPPDRQDWARPAEPADFHQHLDRFHLPQLDHAALIAATAEPFVFPMCDRDPLPRWSHGRVTLLGDAAHPMYPMGSNGAGQAILDATSLAANLARHADPTQALLAYQYDRLPSTSAIVLRNRQGGPEEVINIVEERAPDGFTRLADVIDPTELEAIVSSYTQLSRSDHRRP
jgi:2-polyprenyl-6-methoxyphenol hydroxylase-like FAD-dependent oxidoreductase